VNERRRVGRMFGHEWQNAQAMYAIGKAHALKQLGQS
jgi:hypothetical protein